MRRPTRSAILALVASVLLVLGLGITSSPAMASTVTPTTNYSDPTSFLNGSNNYYNQCGRYWPSQGVFEVYKTGSSYEASLRFRVSQQEKNALNDCVRHIFQENTLEIDFTLHGLHTPAAWDNYSVYTNIPGAIHDTAALDAADHASPGLTYIIVNNLQVGVDYVAIIAWNDPSVTPITGDVPRVSIEWMPSHFAREGETYCSPFLLTFNPAYCVFGTYGRVFLSGGYYNGPHPAGGDGLPFDNNSAYSFPPTGGTSGDGIGANVTLPALAPPSPPALYHGPVPDAVIIESTEGHLYVAAGGRLFWFDQNNAGMLAAFRTQMQQKYGTTTYPLMDAAEVHAVEVNRTSAGVYSPGSNMPSDNTFMYEYGTTQQYVIKYQHPFAVGDSNEVVALGGQDRAVMVPPSITDLQTHPAQWVQNDLLRFGNDPSVWHYAGSQGFRVPGVPTRDCLQVRWNRGVTYMPASAWNYFPTHSTQQAACDFTHGQWLYGVPSNRQVEVLYGVGHYVQSGEVAGLGGTNQARPVSDFTIDWLMGLPLNLPANHLFKAPNTPTVYMVSGGQFHLVGSPSVRDCLMATYGVVVEAVPQSFIDQLPQGAGAQCPYEGRQLLGSGGSVDYVQNGLRHHVQNPAIRDCLIGRVGTGQPIAVDATTWNSYTQGSDAYCPYETEFGLNFVQEAGDPTVWLVGPPAAPGQPGVKRHAGNLCVPDPYTTQLKKYHVWTVPVGETAGHVQGADFWQSGPACQALPG